MEPKLYRIRGEIFASQGPSDADIESAYEESLGRARAQPNRLYEMRAAMSLAAYWRKTNRPTEADSLLATIGDGITGRVERTMIEVRRNRAAY